MVSQGKLSENNLKRVLSVECIFWHTNSTNEIKPLFSLLHLYLYRLSLPCHLSLPYP